MRLKKNVLYIRVVASWTWVDFGYVIKKPMKNSGAKFQFSLSFYNLKPYFYASNRKSYGFKNMGNEPNFEQNNLK